MFLNTTPQKSALGTLHSYLYRKCDIGGAGYLPVVVGTGAVRPIGGVVRATARASLHVRGGGRGVIIRIHNTP